MHKFLVVVVFDPSWYAARDKLQMLDKRLELESEFQGRSRHHLADLQFAVIKKIFMLQRQFF